MKKIRYEVNVKFDEDAEPSKDFSSSNLTFIGALINVIIACWKLRSEFCRKTLDYISIDRQIKA